MERDLGERAFMAGGRRILCAVAAAGLVWTACGGAGRSLDVAGAAARQGATLGSEAHSLDGLAPHLLPWRGRLYAFTCRFRADRPVTFAVSGVRSDAEQQAVDAALRAWAAALGLRFVASDEPALHIEIRDGAVPTPAGSGDFHAISDCAVEPPSPGAGLGAELGDVRVEVSRVERAGEAGTARLAGRLLKAVGHGLGFSGRARAGIGILGAQGAALEVWGRAVLRGEVARDATLGALYAIRSGTLLVDAAVDPWRTDLVDRMARLAPQGQLVGPSTRADERVSRIWWVSHDGTEYGLQVPDPTAAALSPEALVVAPEVRTRRALPRTRDARPH